MIMKIIMIAIFSISLLSGCSKSDVEKTDRKKRKTITDEATKESIKLRVQQAHTQITKNSILATFMENLSKKDYKKAFELINPKLRTAWTFERFKRELEEIRSTVKDWKPEATGSFSGNAPQGKYIQATYRLDSDWRSPSSIDLAAMEINSQNKIIKIHIRIPYSKTTPDAIKTITEKFISAMQKKDYKAVSELMSPNCRTQFPFAILARLQPIIGKDASKVFSKSYRLNANTVWYAAVKIGSTEDIATSIELIISTDKPEAKIISLNFKGRARK
jgi:hypothetical protein